MSFLKIILKYMVKYFLKYTMQNMSCIFMSCVFTSCNLVHHFRVMRSQRPYRTSFRQLCGHFLEFLNAFRFHFQFFVKLSSASEMIVFISGLGSIRYCSPNTTVTSQKIKCCFAGLSYPRDNMKRAHINARCVVD